MIELILCGLWIDRLPTTVKQIPVPNPEDASLDLLTDSGDRIYSKIDQNVNSLHKLDDTQDKTRNLQRTVTDLQKQINDILFLLNHRPRSPSLFFKNYWWTRRSASWGRQTNQDICWFHWTFGNTARNFKLSYKYQIVQRDWLTGMIIAVNPTGRILRWRLFYVWGRNYKLKFLMDTDAAISVIPPEKKNPKALLFQLQEANSFPRDTDKSKSLSLNIGTRPYYTWSFT